MRRHHIVNPHSRTRGHVEIPHSRSEIRRVRAHPPVLLLEIRPPRVDEVPELRGHALARRPRQHAGIPAGLHVEPGAGRHVVAGLPALRGGQAQGGLVFGGSEAGAEARAACAAGAALAGAEVAGDGGRQVAAAEEPEVLVGRNRGALAVRGPGVVEPRGLGVAGVEVQHHLLVFIVIGILHVPSGQPELELPPGLQRRARLSGHQPQGLGAALSVAEGGGDGQRRVIHGPADVVSSAVKDQRQSHFVVGTGLHPLAEHHHKAVSRHRPVLGSQHGLQVVSIRNEQLLLPLGARLFVRETRRHTDHSPGTGHSVVGRCVRQQSQRVGVRGNPSHVKDHSVAVVDGIDGVHEPEGFVWGTRLHHPEHAGAGLNWLVEGEDEVVVGAEALVAAV
mmetsp:Transcript_8935/g.21214  ORF Transcript_8935/g.21214 Transcript_8935/m.21214 type:complete len:392 (+) Transcript_8935:1667-2842(+)